LASLAEQLMSRALVIRKLSGERDFRWLILHTALRKHYHAQGATMTAI